MSLIITISIWQTRFCVLKYRCRGRVECKAARTECNRWDLFNIRIIFIIIIINLKRKNNKIAKLEYYIANYSLLFVCVAWIILSPPPFAATLFTFGGSEKERRQESFPWDFLRFPSWPIPWPSWGLSCSKSWRRVSEPIPSIEYHRHKTPECNQAFSDDLPSANAPTRRRNHSSCHSPTSK